MKFPALMLALLLAGCGPTGSGAEAQCEREANDDPELARMRIVILGNPSMRMTLRDDMTIARDRARRACLLRLGQTPRTGGVEAPREQRSLFDGFR